MPDDTILFVTDTHAGADRPVWTQQTPRGDLLPGICAGVRQLARTHGATLIVHGGDLTEASDLATASAMLERLGLPVVACLGNHDLMTRDATAAWRRIASHGLRLAPAVVPLQYADLVLLNGAWACGGQAEMFWDGQAPAEALTGEQAAWLDEALAAAPERPACLVVHAPLDPLPPRLTGLEADLHGPSADYADDLNRLLDAHPRVRLVLAGHNHATCATRHGDRVHLTTSSAIEVPFEVRLIRFGPRGARIETVAAMPTPADAVYDAAKAWVNGMPEDRTLEIPW